ncbi:DMT family transporter [Paracoccus suum]|uniref:DMT family transporter n=2 Tax=Paracoccus suum TaxID=2259340 RepID=A0A344PNZ7_9RHOB|nr:DMT family transporter [Paracoccus suum]
MAILATHDVIIKSLGSRFSPLQILFFVALFSLPLVTLALAHERAPALLRPVAPRWVMLRTIAMVIAAGSSMYAFAVLPLAETYALLFTMPLWVTVMAIPLLGERVGLHRWLAILVGLAGVLVVLRPGSAPLTAGHAAALVGAFCSALTGVIARRLGGIERSVVMLYWPVMGMLATAGLAMPLVYRPPAGLDLGLMAVIAVLNLLGNAVMLAAYRAGEAAIVAPMQYSQIIWAVMFGWLLFAEHPDAVTLAGVTMIVAAGLYIVARERRGSDNRPVTTTRTRPLR